MSGKGVIRSALLHYILRIKSVHGGCPFNIIGYACRIVQRAEWIDRDIKQPALKPAAHLRCEA